MAERRRPRARRGSPDLGQRVRLGLTGLACVFLLVLVATALFGGARTPAPTAPEEPLAELGVAPGSGSPRKPAAQKLPALSPPARIAPGPTPH